MGRKLTFLDDENIPPKSVVLYCFTPFEKPDRHGKFVFKVGKSRYFGKRMENFHTDFVNGVFFLRILHFTPQNSEKGIKTMQKFLAEAEEELFEYLQINGAKRLRSKLRVKKQNEDGGLTEWFYGNEKSISQSFLQLHNDIGGTLHKYKYQTKSSREDYDNRKENGGFSGEYIVEKKFV